MTLSTNKRRPVIIGPDTPSDPKETDLWINSTNNKIYRYNGSTWAVVSEAITEALVQSASANALTQATAQVNAVIDSAPGALNTLNELAAALNDDASFATNIVNSLTSASVGLANYIGTASATIYQYTQDATMALGADLSAVINSASTQSIAAVNTASTAAIILSNTYTDVEINLLEAALIGTINTASAAAVTTSNSYADGLTTTDIDEGTNLYFTNQRAINAGSATYLTTTDAATTYLPQVGGTVTGSLTISGNLNVAGSATYLDATNINVTDSLINLSVEQIEADALDQGFTASYGQSGNTEQTHKHRGIVYDVSDNKWKIFSNVTASAISTTVDFTNAVFSDVKVGSLETIGNVTASAFIGDGSQLSGIDLSTKKDKLNSFDQETASYELVLSNRDQIVEMNVSSANTLTVPPNSSVAFPVGTEITILQTGTGQTTITPGSGVTINATPGLKIRAQWGSATVIKRGTDTWVAIGDLSA